MSITVTATPTGAAGTTLRVLVLTGATESGGAVQQPSGASGGHVSITPNFSNSFIAWSNNNEGSNGAWTALTGNTILDNISTTGGQRMATGYFSGTVTASSAVSAGATPASSPATTSAYELPATGGSTPLLDASAPVVLSASAGSAALTTAPFSPPFGSVVVVLVSGANFPTGWTVTDSSGLTWTKRADNTDGQQIWTATVPPTATMSGSGTLSAGITGQITQVGTPAFVKSSSGSVTGNPGTGQGWASGNTLVAVVTAAAATSVTTTSAPSGWANQVESPNTVTAPHSDTAIWTKTSNGSEPNPTFTSTFSGTGAMTCTIFELVGTSGTPASTGTYGSGGTASTVAYSVSAGSATPAPGCFIIAADNEERSTATSLTWSDTGAGNWQSAATDAGTSTRDHNQVNYLTGPASGGTPSDSGSWISSSATAYGSGVLAVFAAAAGPIAGTAALSGTGSLTVGGQFAGTAALAGLGSLGFSPVLAAAASLSGQGSLAAAGLFTAPAQLSGSGTLTGSWGGSGAGSATLSGSGTLAAASRFLAAIGLSGQGTFGGAPIRPSLAALSGLGTLAVFPKPFLLNTSQGLSPGTTPTAGNSGGASGDPWDSTSIGSLASVTADSTVSPHGTVSYKFTTGTTVTTAVLIWSTSQGTQTAIFWRAYVFLNALANPPFRFFQARSGASHAGSVFVSNQAFQMSAGSAFTTLVTFTKPVPLNRWFRAEGSVTGDPVNGAVSASLFTSMDATVPDETHSFTGLNTVGALTQYQFGQGNSSASSGPFWLGDAGISAAGPLGPTGPGSTMSGTGTLGVGGAFRGAALLSGQGTLSGAETIIPAVHLSGSGLLVVTGQFQGSAALSGSGLLSAPARFSASAPLSGLGSLGLAPQSFVPVFAPMSGSGTLTAQPTVGAPSPAYLWAVYQRLANIAQREGILYRETVIAGGRGWAGVQYSKAYEAEVAADLALLAWQQATGNTPPTG